MKEVYQKKQFKIYKSDDGFIVHNNMIKGEFIHSHINNYNTAKWIIGLAINKKCPYDLSKYLVISLIRISTDEKYIRKLKEILNKKNNKKEYYINVNKGEIKNGRKSS